MLQPWKMEHSDICRDKVFRFHLKANATPNSLHRFSLLLKHPRWRLRFGSEPGFLQKLRSFLLINKRSVPHLGIQLKLCATPKALHNFSLLLKLRQWRIRVKSEPGSQGIKTEIIKKNGCIKSRFLRIFKKLGVKGRVAPKAAKFAVGRSRLLKCGGFVAIAAVGFAFGFDVANLVQCAMNL